MTTTNVRIQMRDFHRVCLGLVIVVAALNGCKKDPAPSLFDPNYVSGVQPAISTIAPQDSGIAGVGVVTLTGTNFSPVKENNFVYFNTGQAVILQASATQLVVNPPDLTQDTVMVKVGVLGSELFSVPSRYKLIAAVSDIGVVPNVVEIPTGIECDATGKVYVSMENANNQGLGTRRYLRSGVRDTLFFSPAPQQVRWAAMKFGPGPYLYASATRALFRIPVGGGSSALWKVVGPGGSTVGDFDFDANQTLWAAGFDASVYSVNQAGTLKAFPLPSSPTKSDIRSVRVFNGYLYLGGKVLPDTVLDRVVRRQIISADSLGPVEDYFRFSGSDTLSIYAITFTDAGEMFVGTDAKGGTIILVHTNGSYEKFYPGLLKAKASRFTFGLDGELFFSRSGLGTDNRIVRVRTQKLGAPYYGRQ